MKKEYEKLTTEPLLVESEGGFMAGSVVDKIAMQVEVDDYVETDFTQIGFD